MNLYVNIVASSYQNNNITSSDDFDALIAALIAANKTYDNVMESAQASAHAAKCSEDNAHSSETNAKASETNAANSAALSKNYCEQAEDRMKTKTVQNIIVNNQTKQPGKPLIPHCWHKPRQIKRLYQKQMPPIPQHYLKTTVNRQNLSPLVSPAHCAHWVPLLSPIFQRSKQLPKAACTTFPTSSPQPMISWKDPG